MNERLVSAAGFRAANDSFVSETADHALADETSFKGPAQLFIKSTRPQYCAS